MEGVDAKVGRGLRQCVVESDDGIKRLLGQGHAQKLTCREIAADEKKKKKTVAFEKRGNCP